MKKLSAALFVFSFIACLFSCKEDENLNPITFTEITAVDTSCILLDNADLTDWTNDTSWLGFESSLLAFSDTFDFDDSLAGSISVLAACPNPNTGAFNVSVSTERACKLKYVFVNNSFQILHYANRQLPAGPLTFSFDFSGVTSFHKGNYYRMYYMFLTGTDSVYYKGHGDILIE